MEYEQLQGPRYTLQGFVLHQAVGVMMDSNVMEGLGQMAQGGQDRGWEQAQASIENVAAEMVYRTESRGRQSGG